MTDYRCPYLATINRKVLDFDMKKTCSVTLIELNVYCCLVCGKYFGGRGQGTPAYTHSLECNHYMFINLDDSKIYCLPDNYELRDSSLNDIKYCLSPSFNQNELKLLDVTNRNLVRDINGVSYLPGFMGINNLGKTSHITTIVHAICHVNPIRNFFLQESNYKISRSSLLNKFGILIRKIWSNNNFKSTISPNEFIHEIFIASKGKFTIGKSTDCIDFLRWILNEVHKDLGNEINQSRNKNKRYRENNTKNISDNDDHRVVISKIIEESFHGIIRITTRFKSNNNDDDDTIENVIESPFSYLGLNPPPIPLFRDTEEDKIIPEISLQELLSKYDGRTWTQQKIGNKVVEKKYQIIKLPKYLILHVIRFSRNNFAIEKNSTRVIFPIFDFDLSHLISNDESNNSNFNTTYNLIANICHDSNDNQQSNITKNLNDKNNSGTDSSSDKSNVNSLRAKAKIGTSSGGNIKVNNDTYNATKLSSSSTRSDNSDGSIGSYKIHVSNKASKQWFEIQDLQVEEILPQFVGLSEAYLLWYELKQ